MPSPPTRSEFHSATHFSWRTTAYTDIYCPAAPSSQQLGMPSRSLAAWWTTFKELGEIINREQQRFGLGYVRHAHHVGVFSSFSALWSFAFRRSLLPREEEGRHFRNTLPKKKYISLITIVCIYSKFFVLINWSKFFFSILN